MKDHEFNQIGMMYNQQCPFPQLHPDLLPYVKGDELWHPLIQVDGGLQPAIYNRINQSYRSKKELEQHPPTLPPNEWQKYHPDLPLPERQRYLLVDDWGRRDSEYFKMLGQIWTDPDVLGCTSSFLECLLGLEHFAPTQPLSENVRYMMTEQEQEKLANLPEQFTVYRGHHRLLLRGISWTLKPEVAILWSAGKRFGYPDQLGISHGIVDKTAVIAYIERWNEDEIIVPTSSVRDIVTADPMSFDLPESWFTWLEQPLV